MIFSPILLLLLRIIRQLIILLRYLTILLSHRSTIIFTVLRYFVNVVVQFQRSATDRSYLYQFTNNLKPIAHNVTQAHILFTISFCHWLHIATYFQFYTYIVLITESCQVMQHHSHVIFVLPFTYNHFGLQLLHTFSALRL